MKPRTIIAGAAALALLAAAPAGALEVNEKAFIFGDKVNVRQEPDIKSPVIVLMKAGDQVQVLGKSKNLYNSDGITDIWYQVKGRTATGYVWGGVLAKGHVADYDGDGTDEVFMARADSIGEGLSILKARLASDGKIIGNITHKTYLPDMIVTSVRYPIKGGFKPEVPLAAVSYLNGDPAIEGEVFLHFRARQMIIIADAAYSFTRETGEKDCPAQHSESKVAFPSDRDGKSNTLLIRTREGCLRPGKKKKEDFRVEKTHDKRFTWDGKGFFKGK